MVKRNGRTESFDRGKIARSLRACGVSEQVARDISQRVTEREGMTSDDIRAATYDQLRNIDQAAADRYADTRRLTAVKAVDAAHGVAFMTAETMNRMHVEPGQMVEVRNGDHRETLKVERRDMDSRSISLSDSDLGHLGTTSGSRISVRRGA